MESVDLSSFGRSEVVQIGGMFDGCESLKEIDLSNFETPNLKYMVETFRDCKRLESLDIRGIDCTHIEDPQWQRYAFKDSPEISRIVVGSSWRFLESSGFTGNWEHAESGRVIDSLMFDGFDGEMPGTYVKTTKAVTAEVPDTSKPEEAANEAAENKPETEENQTSSQQTNDTHATQQRVQKAVQSLVSRLRSLFSWFK